MRFILSFTFLFTCYSFICGNTVSLDRFDDSLFITELSTSKDEQNISLNVSNSKGLQTIFLSAGLWREIELIYKSDTLKYGWDHASNNNRLKYGYVVDRKLLIPISIPHGFTKFQLILRNPATHLLIRDSKITLFKPDFVDEEDDNIFHEQLPILLVIFILGLYNLVLFFLLKDKGFLAFSIMRILFVMSWVNGYGFLGTWSDSISPIFVVHMDNFFSFSVMGVYVYFIQTYLKTYHNSKRMHTVLNWIKYLCAGGSVLCVIGVGLNVDIINFISNQLSTVILPAPLLIAIVVTIISVFKKIPKATFFLAAGMLVFAVCGIINNLAAIHILQENWFTKNLINLAAIIESILYSAGLASTVIDERKEKYQLQKKLIKQYEENESLNYRINQELEDEVQRRTQELVAKQTIIEKSLHDKDVLIKEIHHRVKNNLQMMYGMLSLQIQRRTEEPVKQQLLATQGRIKSMALVHEQLYEMDNFYAVSLDKFIDRVGSNLMAAYGGIERNISFENKLIGIEVTMDKIVPISLIINEIITNSCKHAFTNCTYGNSYVNGYFKKNIIYLNIGNDGNIPENFEETFKTSRSLGTLLIRDLCEQLDAQLSLSFDSGVNYHIEIPLH